MTIEKPQSPTYDDDVCMLTDGIGWNFTWNAENRLIYYNYRYYSTDLGRWLSRDPIWERGGVNLYSFIKNEVSDTVDFLGLTVREIKNGKGEVVGTVDDEWINCIGYASQQDGDLQGVYSDDKSKGHSLKEMFKALGYRFAKNISASDCKAYCDCDNYMMLYVYLDKNLSKNEMKNYQKKYKRRDFLREKTIWAEVGNNIDFHGLRGEKDGTYTYQGFRTEKGSKGHKIKRFIPTRGKPDYFGNPKQVIAKYCGCKR